MEKIKFDYILIEKDINEIAPKECVGVLFKNEHGVLNIPETLEDVQKSYQYFKNKPQELYFLYDGDVKVNDWFIPKCNNHLFNLKPLQYLGPDDENNLKDVIKIYDGEKEHLTTMSIFLDSRLILATTNEELELPTISIDWIKDWFVVTKGVIDKRTRILLLNGKPATSKNDEIVLIFEEQNLKTIKAVYGRQPIFEIVKGISAGVEVDFGIARDRNPDTGWGEFSQYNLELSNKIEEVLFDDNMKKILLEDICAYYGKNAYKKLKEFDLLNF